MPPSWHRQAARAGSVPVHEAPIRWRRAGADNGNSSIHPRIRWSLSIPHPPVPSWRGCRHCARRRDGDDDGAYAHGGRPVRGVSGAAEQRAAGRVRNRLQQRDAAPLPARAGDAGAGRRAPVAGQRHHAGRSRCSAGALQPGHRSAEGRSAGLLRDAEMHAYQRRPGHVALRRRDGAGPRDGAVRHTAGRGLGAAARAPHQGLAGGGSGAARRGS